MSRTLSRPSYYFQYAFPAFVFAICFILFTTQTPYASADPHAVFYTDRAQEQLFYNTLAALNQADFVEPPTLQSGQFSRESLVDLRESTLPSPLPGQTPLPFSREQNPTLNATRTQLPGIIARNITLEGNDLWTAYLFQQFALETDVRTSLSKLTRIICTDALGQTGCNNEPGPSQNQSTAFPTDIKEYIGQDNLPVVSKLFTQTESENNFQAKLTGTDGVNPVPLNPNIPGGPSQPGPYTTEPKIPESLKVPRSSSAEIAALHNDTENKPEARTIWESARNSIVASLYNTGLDSKIFSKFTLADKGEVTYPDDASFDDHLDILSGITSILPASIEIAARGKEEGLAFKQYREQTPALAKYTLTKEEGGGVKGTITNPSTGIEALINTGAQQLANQTINQNISGTQEITNPGRVPLLPVDLRPEVAGISTENGPQGGPGEVAGIATFAVDIARLYNTYYSDPKPNPNSPTTGVIPYFEEKGPDEFLQALGATPPKSTKKVDCGFCVSLDEIIAPGGVTQTMNEVYSDMYCFFFPRTAACVARQNPDYE
ncbi:MAG: hypothetical protein O3A36_00310 [bacterium]|nr:hypothetical protein [bacterium]